MSPACGAMTASSRPRGIASGSTAARYPSTSRTSAPGTAGYQVPATAAGRVELTRMADTLTRADVERIAALARLELTPDEVTLFAGQLTAILAYADQVQQVDTSGIDPAAAAASGPPPVALAEGLPTGALAKVGAAARDD